MTLLAAGCYAPRTKFIAHAGGQKRADSRRPGGRRRTPAGAPIRAGARPGWTASLMPVFGPLLAASLVAAPAPASAGRPLAEVLRVEPGASCLDAKTLAETIESWLGRSTVDAAVKWIEVRGDPARADTVEFAVEIRGERVERSFDPGPSKCEELHAVVGLAIAIAVDTSVLEGLGYEVVDPGEVASPQAQEPERPPLARRTRKPEAPPPARRTPRVALTIALRGGPWFGVLPGIAGGAAGQLELGWRKWIDLRLTMFGGYGGRRALDTDTSVALGLVGGRVDVCAALVRTRVRPRLCFGPAGGALQIGAKAPGVRDAIGPWAAVILAPELRIWAGRRFALDVSADLVVPVVRTVLAERDPSKVGMIGDSIAVPPVGVMLGLGAAFTIR